MQTDSLVISENSVQFEGGSLAFKHWFNPQALSDEPLIVLHGWMDNAASFDLLAPLLPVQNIYALDFSGHGLSSHKCSGDYYIWSFVSEVLALVEHLELKQFSLLGHSMGGAVASLYAGLFPNNLNKLISLDMVGPLGLSEEKLPGQMRKAIIDKALIDPRAKKHYDSLHLACQARANRGISLDSASLLAVRGVKKDVDGYYWSVDRQLARANLVSLSETQVKAFMSEITQSCLLVTAKSTWAHRREAFEQRVGYLSNCTLHELEGGHFQHMEGQVETLASLVSDFLSLADQ